MKTWRREKIALWGSVITALGAAAVAGFLIADGIAEIRRAALEAELVEGLEERVRTDADVAEILLTEQERQTERSVSRQGRNRRLGYVLLAATVSFLCFAKWRQSLEGEKPPLRSTEEAPLVSRIGAAPVAEPPMLKPGVDLSFVDEVIERVGSTSEAAIAILQALQSHYRYLPEPALHRVCEGTQIGPAQLIGVASFYAQFRRRPVGRCLVRVCHGTACHVAGVGPIMDELRRRLVIAPGDDTDPQRRFTLDPVNCLGCCSLAPVMMVEDRVAGRLTPMSACVALEAAEGQS